MENQTQQPEQPQAPIQQTAITNAPIKPKKAFKKWILVTLVIILVLSLPIGGYLLLSKMGIKPKASTITIQNTKPTPAPNPSESWKISDFETKGMKIYKNTKYNFSFIIPSNWKAKFESNRISFNSVDYSYNESIMEFKGGSINIYYEKSNFNTIEEFYKDFDSKPHGGIPGLTRSIVRIDNLNAYQTPATDGPASNINTVLINNNIKFDIDISYEVNNKNYIPIYNNLLASFKFTDTETTVDTSGWKTYTDSRYDFSLKYPQNMNENPLIGGRDYLVGYANLVGGVYFDLIYENGRSPRPQASSTYVHVYDSENLDLAQWITKYSTEKPHGVGLKKELYTYKALGSSYLANLNGVKFESQWTDFKSTNIAVKKGDYIYIYGYLRIEEDLSQQFEKMLTTFKFTE